MLRFSIGLGLVAALLAPGVAQAEATLKLLKTPVAAGEVVRIRLHVDAPLSAPLHGIAGVGGVGPFTETAKDTYEAEYSPPRNVGPALAEIVVYEDRKGGIVAYTLAN